VVGSVPLGRKPDPSSSWEDNSSTTNRSLPAPPAGGIFSPQRPLLHLDSHAYSPSVLGKVVEAGGQVKSFKLAAVLLERLADVSISPRHVANLTEEIGEELRQARDQRADDWLHHRRKKPAGPIPQAVAVAVDGGSLQTRAEGQRPGVHLQGWREDKVACLHTLHGPTFQDDPHPQPPACFLDAPYVDDLVQDLKSHKRLGEEEEQAAEATEPTGAELTEPSAEEAETPLQDEQREAEAQTRPDRSANDEADEPATGAERNNTDWPPVRLVRTCVATQQSSAEFGPLVAQEAYARGFFEAPRRAYLGDGLKYNWSIHKKWFKDFTAITDFVHPLSYLYVSATAVSGNQAERWELYVEWMTWCWQGRVALVLDRLKQWQARLGPIRPEEKPPDSDARVVLAKAVTYLENNQSRMDYPSYRRLGLPVTSSAVESLIKEFNYRVKGTEKFWNRPEGTERILQVRAAVLSDDDRLSKHLKNRPGSPLRRYRAKDPNQ
jgi:hypothetical protein